jgi:hypothetical protein
MSTTVIADILIPSPDNGTIVIPHNLTVSGNLLVIGTATETVASTTSTVTAVTTNATFYPVFVSAATGNLAINTDSDYTFNPSTDTLTTTTFVGALTGLASSATTAAACTGNSATATLATTATTATTAVGVASAVKGSLPAATGAGQVLYVSDATGLHVTGSLCFSTAADNTHWIDVTTGVAVV